jgi:hypothetical protein
LPPSHLVLPNRPHFAASHPAPRSPNLRYRHTRSSGTLTPAPSTPAGDRSPASLPLCSIRRSQGLTRGNLHIQLMGSIGSYLSENEILRERVIHTCKASFSSKRAIGAEGSGLLVAHSKIPKVISVPLRAGFEAGSMGFEFRRSTCRVCTGNPKGVYPLITISSETTQQELLERPPVGSGEKAETKKARHGRTRFKADGVIVTVIFEERRARIRLKTTYAMDDETRFDVAAIMKEHSIRRCTQPQVGRHAVRTARRVVARTRRDKQFAALEMISVPRCHVR